MDNFSKRDYKPDGEGGLFTIKGCYKDLRKHDIWYPIVLVFRQHIIERNKKYGFHEDFDA